MPDSDDIKKKLEGEKFPCPLCRGDQDIRIDKNSKPYLICDPCGVQLFIRKRLGIRKLSRKLGIDSPLLDALRKINLFEQ